jgi:hypothetical protein
MFDSMSAAAVAARRSAPLARLCTSDFSEPTDEAPTTAMR